MDSKFLGTWELDTTKGEGMADYGKAMDFTEEQAKLYANLKYSFTVKKEGDIYELDVDFKGTIPNVHYSIKGGETIDYTSPDGRKSKLTLTFEGGNPLEQYEYPETSKSWSITRTVEGDVMKAVHTTKGVSMTQYLNRVL